MSRAPFPSLDRTTTRSSTIPTEILTCNPSPDSYPKHVWSPAGGWYAQPANWKANTVIAGVAMAGVVAAVWSFSAKRETWARKPEAWEWHPSRLCVPVLSTHSHHYPRAGMVMLQGRLANVYGGDRWSKQLIEFDKEDRLAEGKKQ